MNNCTKSNIIKKNTNGVSVGLMSIDEMKQVVEKIEYYYGPAHAFECFRFMRQERRRLGLDSCEYSNSEQIRLEDKEYRDICIQEEIKEHFSKFCKTFPYKEVRNEVVDEKSILKKVASFLPKFIKHV